MNIYDFDDTIYDGESVIDFFFFMLRKNPTLVRFVPSVVKMLFRYKTGKAQFDEIQSAVSEALQGVYQYMPDFEEYMSEFWDKHQHKLKPQFLEMIKPEDMIISASPNVLLEGILPKLGTKNLFCSQVDTNSKEVTFFCFGENKRKLFLEKFEGVEIDCFYSDNMADKPMMELAKHAYLVKGNKVTELIF